jgi:plasmid stabilization system protein ParE
MALAISQRVTREVSRDVAAIINYLREDFAPQTANRIFQKVSEEIHQSASQSHELIAQVQAHIDEKI